MWNPLDLWQQRLARRRYMPRPQRRSGGTTAKFALIALVIIVAAAALLELRRGTGTEAELIAWARENQIPPVEVVEAAGRVRQFILIADIASATAPRRLAADAIERLAASSGIDALAVDVPADEQPYLDRYLATTPEDASILLARPDAIREGDGASRALLDLYRTVWRVNQELGASRRIRIVAIDHPDWPPQGAAAPARAAELFGLRGPHMMQAINDRILNRSPNARILFLVDGLHALKSGGGLVRTGGTTPVEVEWLATLLSERFPQDVFSILVDASPSRVISPAVAAYRGTAAADILRRGSLGTGFALRLNDQFNDVSRSPIRVVGTTGFDFTFEPRSIPFAQLADAYVYYGS